MKNALKNTKILLWAAPIFGLFLSLDQAWAGPVVFDSSNNCATINCGATVIGGSYETNPNNNVDPFILQVFSTGRECVRLAVTSQGTDLETVLVSPSGAIWKDDDGGGALRPLIKANTDVRGWYTVQIARFNGTPANADFTLNYGRYPLGNVNCSAPTTPLTSFSQQSLIKPSSESIGTPPPQGPNSR